ncbi:hypothetical protein F0160_22655 [Paraburkholderia sp. JPY303]|uniref:hypothetical protein n=1 Tax=Paraburkholderia atlantica TaxID=2654982 RepID=UPI00159234EA|nr:hypothetical protein [Paraburkholderia atlantica]NUY33289.1 hypothetical protein [Paraburkholderia atlantica]
MSDVAATTPTIEGAAGQEAAFQSFWDAAEAAERPREEGQQENASQADQEGAQDDAAREQGQDNAQADEAKEGAESEAPEYASLNELLTAHKIDPESVMGLHVTAKIDGKETQVPLSDVLKSYQLEGHVNNKSIELSNQRTQFEQERTAARTQFQQQIQQNTALGNLAMQMLTHEYQKVDWNGLRANNPAEFAALNAEFQQRHGQIQNYIAAVQQAAQDADRQQQDTMRQALSGEQEKLMNAVPEWRNQETFTKDREAMSQYARSLGFQDAELSQIYDHRYMRILHDAARYQALQASKPQALKQVRQAPPMAKPGSRVDSNPSAAKRQQVMDRLSRNPRDQDAQAAAFDFFANQ